MIRIARVAAGALLAGALLALVWAAGIVEPPEGMSRRLAAFSAAYPGPTSSAVVERIPCPPLRRLRLYVVCTDDCEGVWRIVGVRGLVAENLVDLNRRPAEPQEETRARLNASIAREDLRLGVAGAREMIGCHLRLAGLHPELALSPAERDAVERARGSEEEMAAIAEGMDVRRGTENLSVAEIEGGFESRFPYWDTASPGHPILEARVRIGIDGRLVALEARAAPPGAPPTGGTASGSTPGTPPT
jgi:hypothetical protein